jgi:hypothetical protein
VNGRGIGVRLSSGAKKISLLHSVKIGSGAGHQLSHLGNFSLGVKWKGWEADHSSLSSPEVKYGVAIYPSASFHGVMLNSDRLCGLVARVPAYRT